MSICKNIVNSGLAAFRFLTVLPLPGKRGADATDLRRSVAFFPVVGLTIGALTAALAIALSQVLPPLTASVVIVLVMAGTSGGLHLDGLADTADGFLSSRPRERVLEIMRDSRTGVMGVLALIGVLMLKIAALQSLPAGVLWRTVLLMPLCGRLALIQMMDLLVYIRSEGLGKVFCERRPHLSLLWATLMAVVCGWLVLNSAGLVIMAGTITVTLFFAFYVRYRIGGITGDTLGGACEIAEASAALIAACWFFAGYAG